MSTITGSVQPLSGLLPELAALMAAGECDDRLAKQVDEALAELLTARRLPSEQTTEWAELAATDRALLRVDDLAAAAGVGVRTLQRAFNDHVGVGPKFVLRRYRLYEAAERAARDERVDWQSLAADLGYADQAHLTREFTATFGEPPAHYARRDFDLRVLPQR
jgi:AraC-like DNA-binding protein